MDDFEKTPENHILIDRMSCFFSDRRYYNLYPDKGFPKPGDFANLQSFRTHIKNIRMLGDSILRFDYKFDRDTIVIGQCRAEIKDENQIHFTVTLDLENGTPPGKLSAILRNPGFSSHVQILDSTLSFAQKFKIAMDRVLLIFGTYQSQFDSDNPWQALHTMSNILMKLV
jgi:hypothetical protein